MSMAQRTASTVLANSTRTPSPRSLDDAAAVLGDLWIDEGFAQGFECREGALFIATHQTTVAYDVGREDCGKPSFGTRFSH